MGLGLLEVMRSAGDVCFTDDHRIGGHLGLQRNWIASTWHADRLRVDWRGAILAHHTARTLVEANRSTDLAGVKQRGDLAIGLLIEPEADFSAVFLRRKPVQIAVRDLC